MLPVAHEVAGHVARESYGRLLAYLAAHCRDASLAEEALGDAFAAALELWPVQGTPFRPEAWLLTIARHKIIDAIRRRRTASAAAVELHMVIDRFAHPTLEPETFPDERLKLMYVCAHPAIEFAVRTPLMLQTVLGLDAARIAAAYLLPAATMSQRLVRAKAKIRDAGISVEIPEAHELEARTEAVLSAVYAAYTLGRDLAADRGDENGLAREAVWLARLTVSLLPNNAEASGLLALILFAEARRGADRDDTTGRFIPLSDQDCENWSMPLIFEAEAILKGAAQRSAPGRFQLEAAIQSVHMDRRRTGVTNWRALLTLYEGLMELAPTLGAQVARAAVTGEIEGPLAGLVKLSSLDQNRVAQYQPYWAVRAALCAAANDTKAALGAFERAIAITSDSAVRGYLLAHRMSFAGEVQASPAA